MTARPDRTIAGRFAVIAAALLLSPAFHGELAAAEKPLFRFAAITDTHIAHPMDMVRFRMFLHTIRQAEPDFLLILGDLCGHAPEYLPQMKEVMHAAGLKVYPLPGNHDDNYARNADWYKSVFERMYYSFDHKGYHFVMNWSQSQPTEWVKKDLAAVPAGTPVVFCQHYPPAGSAPETREPWATVLKHANVKLILAGHGHRHRDGRLGPIRNVALENCHFTRRAIRRGSYYLCEAYKAGRVDIKRLELAGLKLVAPPDEIPTVAVASPTAGQVLRGAVKFRGTAADDRAVRKIQYSVDFGRWRDAAGTRQWAFALDTAKLRDDHHLFRVRAIDSASQASLKMPSLLCLVDNKPAARGNVFRFQQGIDGYAGCADATVRRHGGRKSLTGADGQPSDLENWIWKAGQVEFSEFYIRFDLSKSRIPAGAKIKRVTLTIYGSRQNGVKSADEDRGHYAVAVVRQKWDPEMNWKTRPPGPGWLGRKDPDPKPDLTGKWPYLGGRQIVVPPRPVVIDLTGLADHVGRWIKETSTNHGLVFSPFGLSYNFSAQSSRSAIATLRPRLEIEIEKK